ncbi:MAG: hypothetical protein WKG00_20375 [Polyangiaceae bacterium]
MALLAALALPACDSSTTTPSGDAGDAGAAAPSAASAAASAVPLPADPIDACIEVMRREATPAADAASEARVAKACAEVYKNPVCRDAHDRYDSRPVEDRAMTVTERCRAAYCPSLPEPKPKLCAEEIPAVQDITRFWFELRIAIWRHDLGEDVARKLEREHLRIAAQLRKMDGDGGSH